MNVKNIREILYVVSIHISGEILENQKFRDDTGNMETEVTCFLFVQLEKSDQGY